MPPAHHVPAGARCPTCTLLCSSGTRARPPARYSCLSLGLPRTPTNRTSPPIQHSTPVIPRYVFAAGRGATHVPAPVQISFIPDSMRNQDCHANAYIPSPVPIPVLPSLPLMSPRTSTQCPIICASVESISCRVEQGGCGGHGMRHVYAAPPQIPPLRQAAGPVRQNIQLTAACDDRGATGGAAGRRAKA